MKKNIVLIFLFVSFNWAQDNIFDFTIDKRLFISYAFMNAAGNDGEWRKEGMNPIRIALRNRLYAKLDTTFRNKIRDYVNVNKLSSWICYGPYALINSGPPSFELNIDNNNSEVDSNFINAVKGLQKFYIEFYNNYQIEDLWTEFSSIIQNENLKYKPFAKNALMDITDYCRINDYYFNNRANKIVFQEIPLMSYFTAQTAKVNGIIYIISGPMSVEPSEANFYHEALHHPISEIISKYSYLINKYSKINDLNKGELGYPNWAEFFEECLVRTIDSRMSSKLFNQSKYELISNINSDYGRGLILCPYFNEELEKYEITKLTLDEYFPTMLKNLKFEKEKKRLNDCEQKNQVVK